MLLQNIVRELEFKKPQLDELLLLAESLKTDENRQQVHSKGKYYFIYLFLSETVTPLPYFDSLTMFIIMNIYLLKEDFFLSKYEYFFTFKIYEIKKNS